MCVTFAAMPSGRDPVVILHLSDLHFGPHCRFGGLGANGLDTLARRLAGSVAQAREAHDIEPVALVLATGDIVEFANKKQYQDAGIFFTALAEALEISPARLLFVPGNHDISWAHCELAEVYQKIDRFDDDELERRIHHDKLAPYRDFQSAFYKCAPAALTGATALSAGRAHAFVHAYDDIGVSVAALDSCERETHRVHGGQLGEVQAQALMDHWRADARAHLRIVAVHHNPVADAPANIAAWAEGLKQRRPDDEDRADLINHFVADATGFAGRERLEHVTRDCQVSLVLHGHVHTAGLATWSHGRGFDHTQVSAAGSWGLADGKRPADEPMSIQLLRLGPARAGIAAPRLEAIRLSYNPRARQEGHVEPGDFVIDNGDNAIRNLSLSLPSNHPGFRGSGNMRPGLDAGGPGDRASGAPALDRELEQLVEAYRRRNLAAADEWDAGGLGVATREAERDELRPTLAQMYVPLRFTRVHEGGHPSGSRVLYGAPEDEDEATTIEPDAVASADRPMILRGTAGRGKTTWMRWTFCELLGRDDVVPFLIELRSLTRTWAEVPEAERTIERYLATSAARDLSHDLDRAHELVKALLARDHGPRPVLLIDGWDELGDHGKELRRRLKALLGHHPRIGAVVTSRPHEGSKPSHGDGFQLWDLELLDQDGIDTLVRNYFAAAHPGRPDHAERDRADFHDALTSATNARELARTPLLLTMMLIISRSRALPDQRHELYDACVDTLLIDRPKVREREGARAGREYWVPGEKQERLKAVAGLARWLHERDRDDYDRVVVAKRDDVIAYFCGTDFDRDHSAQLVDWLVEIAGLLVERDGGSRVSFVHLSFQEYLCAWHMHRDASYEGAQGRIGLCSAHMDDLAWWEPLRLWAAMVHGDNQDKLAPVLDALIAGRASDGIEGTSHWSHLQAVGFWLAGAILADGHGRPDNCQRWIEGMAHAFTGLGYRHMEECARAWRGSRQHQRRREIQTAWADMGTAWSWLAWQLANDWSKQAGLSAPPVAPGRLAAPVIELMQREGRVQIDAPATAAHEIALSRVLGGATPWWPRDPKEISLLRLWPGRRPVLGMRLQMLLSLGGSDADVTAAILGMEDPADEKGDLALELTWNFSRYLPRNLARDLGRYWAQYLGRYLPQNLARYWARDFGRYLPRDFAWDFSWYFAQNFVQDFARDLGRYWARYLVRDFTRDLAPDPSRPWALAFAWCELRSAVGRSNVRAAVAHADSDGNPLLTLLRAACRVSFAGRPDAGELANPLAALPADTHPVWPALARWLSRCATDEDKRILEHHAAHPEDCDAPLSWGMKYIVRGDLVLADGTEVTLDTLYDQAGVKPLPLLEPMPAELDLGELTDGA